jgi:hypothetical protein
MEEKQVKLTIKNIVIDTPQAKVTIPEIVLEGVNDELAKIFVRFVDHVERDANQEINAPV